MVEFLLGVVIALIIMLSLLNMALYVRVTRADRAQRADALVQEAMDEAAEAEARRSREMDEGFDNVMGYTVKLGRGRSTGGEP
jgi:Tfp pilus assembly protein PilV